MTLRQVIAAWLLGPLLVLGALLLAARTAPAPTQRFGGAQVAAIGSSLTMYAMPARFALSDGRQVQRIGLSVPSERQLLTLFDAAIDEHVETIVLEAAPFLADFTFEPQQGCSAPALTLRQHLRQAQVALVDPLRRLVGARTSLDSLPDPRRLDRPQKIDPTLFATFYPLTIHPPCEDERLRQAVARARAQGIRVDLMLAPRSPIGEAALGQAQSRQLRAEAQALARSLGGDLLAPNAGWSNADFVDQAHLNLRGRTKFVADLDVWLVGLQ